MTDQEKKLGTCEVGSHSICGPHEETKECRRTWREQPAQQTVDMRCGNCDHHSDLHNDDGCSVQIQREDGKRFAWKVDCPCKWNKSQASDLPIQEQSGEQPAEGEPRPTFCECGGRLEYSSFSGRMFVVCPKCSKRNDDLDEWGNDEGEVDRFGRL